MLFSIRSMFPIETAVLFVRIDFGHVGFAETNTAIVFSVRKFRQFVAEQVFGNSTAFLPRRSDFRVLKRGTEFSRLIHFSAVVRPNVFFEQTDDA